MSSAMGSDSTVRMCHDGYNDLPGPLCHGVITKDGHVHLVGHGRANHAGTGDGDVLSAVIAESYGSTPPRPHRNDTDGNHAFYGFECENLGDGKDPWPDCQLDAIERVSAAICRAHGWTARSVIGHKEWTNTKTDPRGFEMPDMRARVAKRLGAKPSDDTSTHDEDTTPTPAISLAQVIAAARKDPAAAQGHTTHKTAAQIVERALAAEGLLTPTWADGSFGTKTTTAYASWQQRCGYQGKDADGIPGRDSLRALGKRHGFTVTD
ncbi:N-acetylmuramoyl-L-alanine amidase [Streptomyces sp. NPDC048506]|uniref:N-acetylmuramoyl-L-alanine amidase n=1 Tax=Streptomyces sp. NPDC048506 TaxID=3155028 RepID=UPI00341B0537